MGHAKYSYYIINGIISAVSSSKKTHCFLNVNTGQNAVICGLSLTYLGSYITALPGQHMSTDIIWAVSQKSNVWKELVSH